MEGIYIKVIGSLKQCLVKRTRVKETERNEMDLWTLRENNIQYTKMTPETMQ